MRVFKPQALGLLSRPFEYRRRKFCGIGILAQVPLDGRRTLLSEISMWKMVSQVLGEEAALDAAIPKARGEYLVSGQAWPVSGQAETATRIRVRLGNLDKKLNVIGDRYFKARSITSPESFQSMSLGWECAFGGEGYKKNPNGKGFKPIQDPTGINVHPLPNIEYPEQMIGLPGQRPDPASFGPVEITWPQRKGKAGTYDKDWLQKHFPAFAPDVDWSFFNISSEDQQAGGYFEGTEPFILEGLHPSRPRIKGELPGIRARCFVQRSGASEIEEPQCHLTTVWFFPDQERLVMIFHTSIETEEPDSGDIASIMIAAEELAQPRTADHFRSVFLARNSDQASFADLLRDSDLLPMGLDPSDTLDIESLMSEGPERIRQNNAEERLREELSKAKDAMEGSPIVSGNEGEDQVDTGAFDVEFPNPSQIKSEDIPELMKKLEKESEEFGKKAKGLRADGQRKLEEGMKQLQERFPEENIPVTGKAVGPPTFSAKSKEERIRKGIDSLRASGADVSNMEANLLNPEFLKLIRHAEKHSIIAYRQGAQHQAAAPSESGGKSLANQLLSMLEAGESLDAADFTGADLSGMNLSGANLSGIFLESANLSTSNLSGATLDNAVLARSSMENADLQGATLQGANLARANLSGIQASEANFKGANLTDCDLRNAKLDGSNLLEADCSRATFEGTSLSGVLADHLVFMDNEIQGTDFSNAQLNGAIFLRSNLGQCDFRKAELVSAVFMQCSGRSASFAGSRMDNLRAVEGCDFSGSDFSKATIQEANLRETTLVDCSFRSAILDKSDLSGAMCGRSEFWCTVARQSQWVKTDLRDTDFSGANLMQSILERSDLRGASLRGSNLYQADLARVHVDRNTNFQGALTKKMRTYPRKFPKDQ